MVRVWSMSRRGRQRASRCASCTSGSRDFVDAIEARAPEGAVLVVAHGGAIRVAKAYCDGVAVEDMAWGPVANASVWGLRRPQPSESVVP